MALFKILFRYTKCRNSQTWYIMLSVLFLTTVVSLSLGPHHPVRVWLGVFVSPQGAGQAITVGVSDMPVLSYSKPQS